MAVHVWICRILFFAAPYPVQAARSSAFQVTGFCEESFCNGMYTQQGTTASGAPWYKREGEVNAYMYHDLNSLGCGTSDQPLWICDFDAPNASKMHDLDVDGTCRFGAYIHSSDASGPPEGSASWGAFCSSAWKTNTVTLQFIDGAMTTPTASGAFSLMRTFIKICWLQVQSLGCEVIVCIGISAIIFLVYFEARYFSGPEIKNWWCNQNYGSRVAPGMPFHVTSAISSVVPPIMLLSCFTFTMFNNFYTATRTHCGHFVGKNFMPSISACIVDLPQRYIWRIGVACYVWQRVAAGFAHYLTFKAATKMCPIPCQNAGRLLVNTLEQLFLVLLSYVSAADNNLVHTIGFAGFALSSAINMPMKLMICRHWHQLSSGSARSDSHTARAATRWISLTLAINYSSLIGVLYWYTVHNESCRAYAYSYFAMCEWAFVWSNIAFHHSEWVIMRGVELNLHIPTISEEDEIGERRGHHPKSN